jgi:hypothetical protein
MVLSFAAFGQALSDGLPVGAALDADVHYYPSARPLRALLGAVHDGPRLAASGAPQSLTTTSLRAACDQVGAAVAAEPWTERWPIAVHAAPTLLGRRWVIGDGAGSLPIAAEALGAPGLMALVALCAAGPVDLAAEWTPDGVVPLAAHLEDRVVDVGPHGPWGYG